MAGSFVLLDAFVSVNGVDLSTDVRSVTINYSAELQDSTSMQEFGRRRLPGLRDGSVDIEFKQNYDAGRVDETLFDLVGADPFPLLIRHKGADPVSATNPQYEMDALLETYSPIAGTVGELSTTTCTFQTDGLIDRVVSS